MCFEFEFCWFASFDCGVMLTISFGRRHQCCSSKGKQSKRCKRKASALRTSSASKKIHDAKDLHRAQEQGVELNKEFGALIATLREGSRAPTAVLNDMEVVCEAQSIVLGDCKRSAESLNPTAGVTQALKSIRHEESRKKAAEGGAQRASRDSETVKLARAIVTTGNKENAPPTSRTWKHRNAKGGNGNSTEWRPPLRFPLPLNGSQYSPEFVELFNDNRSKARNILVKQGAT
jgi:hypothetical protein